MTADGYHSVTDALNNVVGMVGVFFAFQPKDKKHPYGHKKFETMTSLFIGGVLIALAFNLLQGAVTRILTPQVPNVSFASLIVMILTALVNVFVAFYEKKNGRLLNSDFLVADATHTFSDVFVSISVIGTLIAVKLGLFWTDTVVSALIALLILKAAFDIIKNCSNVLCDAMVLDPSKINEIVCGFDKVFSCHEIRSHGRFDDIQVDLHVVASQSLNLAEVHNLTHEIEKAIIGVFPGVTFVAVHVEPIESSPV